MKHYYEEGSNTLFVVFHGTGGDEHDLIPLVKEIDPLASIVSLRGNVQENGMNRFFRRYSPTSFDHDNIKDEANIIMTFLADFLPKYEKVVFFGYSNGANMIACLCALYPQSIKYAILLHPCKIFSLTDNISTSTIITYGKQDMLIPMESTLELLRDFTKHGAVVHAVPLVSGHEITPIEIQEVRSIYLTDFFR
ncbi:MAG: alpha/beta hydrolase [Candidatus Woesearchaeota archaeon]